MTEHNATTPPTTNDAIPAGEQFAENAKSLADAIPAGMVRWDGRYGPPRDVDHSKPVMRRNGEMTPTPVTGNVWLHVASHAAADIIAYTPKPSPTPKGGDHANDGADGPVALVGAIPTIPCEHCGKVASYKVREQLQAPYIGLWQSIVARAPDLSPDMAFYRRDLDRWLREAWDAQPGQRASVTFNSIRPGREGMGGE